MASFTCDNSNCLHQWDDDIMEGRIECPKCGLSRPRVIRATFIELNRSCTTMEFNFGPGQRYGTPVYHLSQNN